MKRNERWDDKELSIMECEIQFFITHPTVTLKGEVDYISYHIHRSKSAIRSKFQRMIVAKRKRNHE